MNEEMKPIERVVAALNHQEADRVPAYPLLNGVSRKLVGADYKKWATDASTCAEAYIAVTDRLKPDCICTLTDLSVEAGDFGQKIVYPENEAAHPDIHDRLIKNVDDFKKLSKRNPRTSERMSTHIELCDKLVKAKGTEYPIAAFVFGPLGIASMLRDQAQLYMDIYDKPDVVKSAVEVITDTLIDYCDAIIETGVHAIMIDTLFASKSIMSKDMWKEFEGGCVKRLADHIHDKGCMVMIHNCGHGIYFDVQIEAMKPEAISFLHVPDDCGSYAEAKSKYGSQTTLIGAVDPTWLPQATTEEVEEKCKEHIDIFKKDGGFVLATGCEYPANFDLDHAETIIRVARTYGKY
jgi:uroporphyrinogen decarboxylase